MPEGHQNNEASFGILEVLISTVGQETPDFIGAMNIQTSVVIGNQCGRNETIVKSSRYGRVFMRSSDTKGVSSNRNITLDEAKGDICLLADDDLTYVNHYSDIVLRAFRENPQADLIIFNLHELPITRYVIQHRFHVNYLNYMRFGSVRIAFKLASVRRSGIRFDENFGPGAKVPMGEDTIFLHDCLRAGLNIIAVPDYILTLTNARESTWFHGYDEAYFWNKAKLFRRISKRYCLFLCAQDLIRHKRQYGLMRILPTYRLMTEACGEIP